MNNLKPGFKKGEGKLAGFITKLLKKINRQQPKLEIKVGHSVYPESYCQPTNDMQKNLCLFEDALREIKAKYWAYSLEEVFKHKFGEELSIVDFCYPERLEAYCQRNNLSSREKLDDYLNEYRPMLEEASRRISAEITLARAYVRYRKDNNSVESLKEMARLEAVYGDSMMAKVFKAKAKELRREINKNRGANFPAWNFNVKQMIADSLMSVIKSSVNPFGKEHESREDWMRHWRLLGEELSKEGIDFNSAGEEQEKILAAAWAKVCRRMKNEKIMVYHAQQAKENHISQDLVGDSITLRAKQQPERC